tara:strand:+ start:6362 stop:7522 length:1161 start_codon:yes stop_codon:yes gene_type:complete
MKIICSQSELNTALQLVSRAVASRPTHPVLANVLLTADEVTGKLSLTGFDLNLGIQTSFSASIDNSGAITLPAKLLGEIVTKLSSESPVTISKDETSEQIELFSKNGTYQMRGLPADDFPELPLVESKTSFKIAADSLVKALQGTLFASSTDEAKQLLTGVHLAFSGNSMKAAATDGHRLAVLNSNNAINENPNLDDENEGFSVTLPSRSLREVERVITGWKKDDSISLFCDKGQVVFVASEQIITSRTLEGTYPNYSQLIPETFNKSIIIDRISFISALERIAVLADQHNNVVKISTDLSSNLIRITADAQEVGSGSESIPAKFDGQEIQIAFNVRYLLDGLKVIQSKDISLRVNSSTTPAVISPADDADAFIYLVMPIQIRTDS